MDVIQALKALSRHGGDLETVRRVAAGDATVTGERTTQWLEDYETEAWPDAELRERAELLVLELDGDLEHGRP